jgi:hypothetical protein
MKLDALSKAKDIIKRRSKSKFKSSRLLLLPLEIRLLIYEYAIRGPPIHITYKSREGGRYGDYRLVHSRCLQRSESASGIMNVDEFTEYLLLCGTRRRAFVADKSPRKWPKNLTPRDRMTWIFGSKQMFVTQNRKRWHQC